MLACLSHYARPPVLFSADSPRFNQWFTVSVFHSREQRGCSGCNVGSMQRTGGMKRWCSCQELYSGNNQIDKMKMMREILLLRPVQLNAAAGAKLRPTILRHEIRESQWEHIKLPGVREAKSAADGHWPQWDLIIRFAKSARSWDAA